jgi:xylan 1,4-beta-xylosidase
VWQEMGRPQDPTPEQLDRLRERQGLEEGEPLRVTDTGTEGEGQVALRLPLHALSLLEVTGA